MKTPNTLLIMNNKTYVFECLANVLFDCKQCSCICIILKYKRLKFAAVCIDASFLKIQL